MERPILSYRGGRDIAAELDTDGIVRLPRAVDEQWVNRARIDIERLLATRGRQDHFVRSSDLEQHSTAVEFVNDPTLRTFLAETVRSRFPESSEDAGIDDVALRVVAGPTAEGGAWWFHYDPSVLTVVVPICIPQSGRGLSGELITLANNRPFRRSVLVNIVEKMIVQSGFYRRWLRRGLLSDDRIRIVDLHPGDICLFWGYRTLHANLPCTPGEVRATLVLQVGRPHRTSRALEAAVRVQRAIRGTERAGPPEVVEPSAA